MHLLEQYSLSTASKIDKPYIYETFFPLPIEKYITFQAQSKFESKDYSYWQDVINIISPFLEKNNIKIIQFGKNEEKSYENVIDSKGKTSFNQLAFLMKNSLLHFGPDSLGVHIASMYDIPIVSLYSIIQSSVAGPYFGNKSKHILFDAYKRIGNGKPSYSHQENPKCINLIKPEEIASAILNLLNIEHKLQYKTAYLGERYGKVEIHDFIPNQIVQRLNKDSLLDIRMDYNFNEQVLEQQLKLNKCRIFTNKKINLNILTNNRKNIESIFYFIEQEDDDSFVKELTNLGIKVALFSELSNEEISKKKIKYYEYGSINFTQKPSLNLIEKLKSIKNLYYKSCRNIYGNNSTYGCLAAQKANISKTQDFQPIIDSEEFWNESDNFFFVEMLDKE